MRKCCPVLIFLVAISLSSICWAIDVGNIPYKEGFFVEVKHDYSYRKIELDEETEIVDTTLERISENPIDQKNISVTLDDLDGAEILERAYLKLSYAKKFKERKRGLFSKNSLAKEKVYLYGIYIKAGTAKLKFDDADASLHQIKTSRNMEIKSELDGIGEIEGEWGFFGGIGVNLVYLNSDLFDIGLDLQYNYQKVDSSDTLYENSQIDDIPGNRKYEERESAEIEDITTQEAHAAIVISRRMGNFIPYGGAKVSWYRTEYSGEWSYLYAYSDEITPDNDYKYKGDEDISFKTVSRYYGALFLGTDYELSDQLVLNGEIRAGEEFAINVGLGWMF